MWTPIENRKYKLCKIQVLPKMQKPTLYKILTQEAIEAVQDEGEETSEFGCLLDLAILLSTLDMNPEALYLVWDTFIRSITHNSTSQSLKNQRRLLYLLVHDFALREAREARDKLSVHRSLSYTRPTAALLYQRRDTSGDWSGLESHMGSSLATHLNSHGLISLSSNSSSLFSGGSVSSMFGLTYSVGSASSFVSNSVFMVP